VKRTPLAASRSRFGVIVCGCPPRQPIQSFRSSMAMNSTLGRKGCFVCSATAAELATQTASSEKRVLIGRSKPMVSTLTGRLVRRENLPESSIASQQAVNHRKQAVCACSPSNSVTRSRHEEIRRQRDADRLILLWFFDSQPHSIDSCSGCV
jgi:hypothetical protein